MRRQVDNSRDIADLDLNLDLMPEKDRTVVRLALISHRCSYEAREPWADSRSILC